MLKKALDKMGLDFVGDFNLEHPQDLKNGDFTTNLAMQLAGKEGRNPREFAEQIRASIPANENIQKIEVAGPGYLNFYLSKKFFREELERNFAEQNFAQKEKQKILLEHTSPNLFKPFHIGHMVNNSIGESLSRILKHLGNEVENITFPSDVSPGIAKTIWALKKADKKVENLTLQEIADAYVLGSKEYKENEGVKKEIDKINSEIYQYLKGENKESENIEFYRKGRGLSLKHFQEITKKLGSDFSEMIFESEAEKVGKEIIEKNIPNVFKESEGAVVFEGENFTNVFINSAGFGTYLAKDLGLLKIKKEKYPEVDKSLVVTDVEQKQHFEMVKEAASKIPEIADFANKSEYLQHGRMNFSGNIKISSRYGNVPLAMEVMKRVQENILEKMKERDFSDEEKKEISEKLAIATLKYSILKVTSGKNMAFDIEKDTDPKGDTAIFLLYTYVRTRGILKKNQSFFDKLDFSEREGKIPDLEKVLYRFDNLIIRSAREKSPHHIAKYLFDMAQKFNSLYEKVNFSDENNSDFLYNLSLLKRFEKIMKEGLNLLAIEIVEKM